MIAARNKVMDLGYVHSLMDQNKQIRDAPQDSGPSWELCAATFGNWPARMPTAGPVNTKIPAHGDVPAGRPCERNKHLTRQFYGTA